MFHLFATVRHLGDLIKFNGLMKTNEVLKACVCSHYSLLLGESHLNSVNPGSAPPPQPPSKEDKAELRNAL